MFNWFLKLLGRGEISTVNSIMAPLKKKQDELQTAKAQRSAQHQRNLDRISKIHSENEVHKQEIGMADAVINQLDSLLNPKGS